MTHATRTRLFFALTDSKTEQAILSNVASHYGISNKEAYAELVDPDAENLLDYVTGSLRAAVYVLMQRHRLAF